MNFELLPVGTALWLLQVPLVFCSCFERSCWHSSAGNGTLCSSLLVQGFPNKHQIGVKTWSAAHGRGFTVLMEVEERVIILESSKWNTHKCYWEEDGTFALEKSSGFGCECVPSLEGVVCCLNVPFPVHQNTKQCVRKGSESLTRGNLWRRPKVGKMWYLPWKSVGLAPMSPEEVSPGSPSLRIWWRRHRSQERSVSWSWYRQAMYLSLVENLLFKYLIVFSVSLFSFSKGLHGFDPT